MTPRDTETSGRPVGRPPSGGPAISARSRSTGEHLAWCDGQWSGTPAKTALARAYVDEAAAIELAPGVRFVTPDDGDLVYAVAVVVRVLGPVDWADAPPAGSFDELFGTPPERSVA